MVKTKVFFVHIWLPAAAMLLSVGLSQANVVMTGQTLPPDIFTFACPGASCPTLLATTTTNWTNPTNTMSGTLTAEVFSDPTNPFGAGDLDFIYQVSNNAASTDSIGRIAAITFTGWLTDVGYASDGSQLGHGLSNGTVAPELVDRNTADTIGFSFNAPLLDLINPGQTSTVLVIETNATNYTAGHANIIDGGVTTVSSYEPAGPSTVPEPTSIVLLATCVLGIALVFRNKLRGRQF